MAFIDPLNTPPPTLDEKLIEAARQDHIDEIRLLIGMGASVRYKDSYALRVAASKNHYDAVSVLLNAGADINAMGTEALRLAVADGRRDMVQFLLENGADVNAMEGEPLIKAVQRHQIDIARDFLAAGAKLHYSNYQAFSLAVFKEQEELVSDMLLRGADPFSAPRYMEDPENISRRIDIAARSVAYAFREDLKANSDPEFFKSPWRDTEEPVLIRAVKMHILKEVLDEMKKASGFLVADDLQMLVDRSGRSLLSMAAEKDVLKYIFQPEYWRNDLNEIKKAWDIIPEQFFKAGIMNRDGFAMIVSDVRQRQIKSKAGKFRI